MQDFAFSAADLAANRAGTFSPDQRAQLEHQQRSALIQVASFVVFFVVLSLFACSALQSWDRSYSSSYSTNILYLPCGLLSALFLLMLSVRIRHMNLGRDLRSGEVASARGALLVREETARWTGRHYIAEVGITRFELSERLFVMLSAFQEHQPGRETVVYYAPTSKTILSFEALAGAPPPPPTAPGKLSFQEALARQNAEERRKDGR